MRGPLREVATAQVHDRANLVWHVRRLRLPARAFGRANSRRAHAGFTLIEMIVVIILIGVVIGVVSISFTRGMTQARIQAASRDLVAALRYTRGQAIVKGQETTFDLNIADNSYQAPGRASVQLPKTMHLSLYTAEQELTSDKTGRIRFFADGASTGGHVSMLFGHLEWRINVDWLTGAVTREELKH